MTLQVVRKHGEPQTAQVPFQPQSSFNEVRKAERRSMSLQCRIVWRDANQTIHVANGITRDVSTRGAFVQVSVGRAIPLNRLVHLQISRDARITAHLPCDLSNGPALAAVYRIESGPGQGGPGYALRLLVEPSTVAPETEALQEDELACVSASA